ncbi:S8 family peptidase [Geodermatophilus sp. YIM 151500]|uniref:S8 family peptidase n=1 Tax=Geodermatophilus sp. YIM 151500 TaxID=2984531 RepID=UPI0021E4E520|nr:S8 family peptidase [Geodermatophilus sp. YIM 151500]MCV2491243.1 S8 family peptidase [Geodermatophilus sp. YIM 151500]
MGIRSRCTVRTARGHRPTLRSAALAAALAVAGVSFAAPSAAAAPEQRSRVIVQLVPGSDAASESRQALARGGAVRHVYDAAVSGFSGEFTDAEIEALRRDPEVALVEPDGVVTATADTPLWSLDRLDQRALPLSGTWTAPGDGAGVTAYVVDTGIAPHDELAGRIAPGHTAFGEESGTSDCNGHGTHVAGTIGGTRSGVASAVTLVPVRVLDCAGAGSWSGVIAGLDWIAEHHSDGAPAVANLSLGGPRSRTVDAAVSRMVEDGITVAVAAGNTGDDACSVSPARVPEVLTTGATDQSDRRAPFSNHGRCVDLFAPGVDIVSTWADGGMHSLSGTSMAAPHVAGAAAVLLGLQPSASPETVADRLVEAATPEKVLDPGDGSPDLLLFVG